MAPPAGFEPVLPPPEAGETSIMRVAGVSRSRFPLVMASELPWCPVVHCTNPCTNDDANDTAACRDAYKAVGNPAYRPSIRAGH
jgi:hypothetical protein